MYIYIYVHIHVICTCTRYAKCCNLPANVHTYLQMLQSTCIHTYLSTYNARMHTYIHMYLFDLIYLI